MRANEARISAAFGPLSMGNVLPCPKRWTPLLELTTEEVKQLWRGNWDGLAGIGARPPKKRCFQGSVSRIVYRGFDIGVVGRKPA